MAERSTRERGLAAEDEAARFLESRGLSVVERNVELAGGELDLIALLPRGESGGERDADTVVFVEVRSRADARAGSPLETINRRKRARVRRTATAWLIARDLWEKVAVRFDVVGITYAGGERFSDETLREAGGASTRRIAENEEAPRIEWIPGAFDVDDA